MLESHYIQSSQSHRFVWYDRVWFTAFGQGERGQHPFLPLAGIPPALVIPMLRYSPAHPDTENGGDVSPVRGNRPIFLYYARTGTTSARSESPTSPALTVR